MAKVTVYGGDAGMRVIVDGDNVNDLTVAAGETKDVEFAGKVQVRVLGIAEAPDSNDAAGSSGG